MRLKRGAKYVGALIGVLILASLLGACGAGSGGSTKSGDATAQPGGSLQVAIGADPETLAPAAGLTGEAVKVISQINEPLFYEVPSGKVIPLLGQSIKISHDGLTYTVQLRSGVHFSNGQPLTARDVVFSLDAFRKSPYYGSMVAAFDSVVASGPLTVTIKTKEPVGGMKAILAFPFTGIVPDNYGGMSEKQFSEHPIGTGPFKFKSWVPGKTLTLVRNPSYWRSNEPLANELVFTVVAEDSSRVSQLRTGRFNVAERPALSQVEALEHEGFVKSEAPGEDLDAIILNQTKPLFADPGIRHAIDLAVDREGIIATALEGEGEPAGSFLTPNIPYFDTSIVAPTRAISEAKSLVAAAVKKGIDPSFKLTTIAGETYYNLASQVIQQNLNEVGFKVTLEPLDSSALFELLEEGKFDASMTSYGSAVADPIELVSYFIDYLATPSGVDTSHLSDLASQAASELDGSRRGELYAKLQEEVAADRSLITLDYKPSITVSGSNVSGFEMTPLGAFEFRRAGFSL